MWQNSQRFWSEQQSWVSAFVAQQKESGERLSRLYTTNKQLWKTKAGFYLRERASLAKRAQTIQYEADWAQLTETIRTVAEQIAPALAKAYDQQLGDLMIEALQKWPVKTGLSKSLLVLSYSNNGKDRFVGSVGSTAPYTFFIAGHPHRKLIEDKAPKVVEEILEQAAVELDRSI